MDQNKDGQLSMTEVKDGLDTVIGKLGGNVEEYKEIMQAMDSDRNGIIDYQEFITAAIDKVAMLNKKSIE